MRIYRHFASLLLVFLAAACVPPPQSFVKSNPPTEFSLAVRRLAFSLVTQVDNDGRGGGVLAQAQMLGRPASPRTIVVDSFNDADTGEINQAGVAATGIVKDVFSQPENGFSVLPLDSKGIAAAAYAVVGTITYERDQSKEAKKYHLYASVINLKSGKVLANSDAWISNRTVDVTPVSIYQNSPVYIRDDTTQMRVSTSRAESGSLEGQRYAAASSTLATATEGRTAYEGANYRTAVSLYSKNIATPGGRTMENYLGLYKAYYALSDRGAASEAFYNLFALAAASDDISTKFLFAVNSVDFVATGDLRSQYDIWLQQIARYFATTGRCVLIVGHSSHTGGEAYNDRLSKARAEEIKTRLVKLGSDGKRISTDGKGWRENQVGTGTDDAQDAFDRRVEFRSANCA